MFNVLTKLFIGHFYSHSVNSTHHEWNSHEFVINNNQNSNIMHSIH